MSGVRLGFLSDSPLIVAQAHTRHLYLVQRGNRGQCYWAMGVCKEPIRLASRNRRKRKVMEKAMDLLANLISGR